MRQSGARSERGGPLPLGIKLSWASGAFGVAILSNGAAALMLFYLTKIVGLAGWVAGVILMISKLYDVVSDPLAGWLSDRHRSPAGRRRPFLLIGAFVNAAALLLIYTVPLHGDRPLVWAYVLAVNLIYTTGFSIFNVPLLAMAPEMTDGYHERSVLQGWRVMFSAIATAVAVVGSGAVLGGLGERRVPGGPVVNSARDYAILAVLFASLTFIGMIIAWRGTRRAHIVDHARSRASIREQFASFIGNRPAMIIIGVKAAQLIGIASASSATLFMLVDVLKGSPALLPFLGLSSLATSVVATPLLARLSTRIGKRGGYLIGAGATAAAALSWIMARPGDDSGWLILRGSLSGIAFSGNVMFAMSMLNDAMELDVHRTGLRREGMYSALYSFVEKFGNALGPAIVGSALSLAGFDATASATAANAGAVRQAALLGIAYVPAGCAVVAVVLLIFYRLDQRALDDARAVSHAGAGAEVMADGLVSIVALRHPDGRSTRYRLMVPPRARHCPVVLFSHGANSSSGSYDRLWSVWAAHGFAVIGPDHIDTGPPAEQAKPPAEGLWATRLADILLPLRQQNAFDRPALAAGSRLDWDAVAAAGHSFGAVVAQALAGARLTDPATHRPVSVATTPMVRACIALSPPGPRPGFVPPDAWSPVRIPSLLQTGDADRLPGFVDDWHARLTGFVGGRDRWTLVGHGVDHYFGGLICRLDARADAQGAALNQIAALSAAFLAGYVGRDSGARDLLAHRAARGDDGSVVVTDASQPGGSRGAATAAMAAAAMIAAQEPMARRQLLRAALALPLISSGLAAAQTKPVFAPSDVVPIKGASPPRPLLPAQGRNSVAPAALAAAQAFSDAIGGTALLVMVDGRIVHERYAAGYDAGKRLKTYSMAKSVMGLAFGLAVAQRLVTLDDPVGRHVAEWRDDPRGRITLRQLLQMRSGLKLESLARNDPKAIELVIGRHVTDVALATPLVGNPGAVFEYNNVDSFLAGLALDRALIRAGRGRYTDFLSRALWRPLGQEDATLEVEFAASGEPRFFAGLDATGRDWLRIGELFVGHGRVGREQVVPAAWIKAMTTASANPSYGLQMWIGQPWTPQRRYGPNTPSVVPCKEPYAAADLVFFDGAGGQRVYMVPSRKLVIVRTGAASPAWEDSTLPNTILRGMT